MSPATTRWYLFARDSGPILRVRFEGNFIGHFDVVAATTLLTLLKCFDFGVIE